MWSVWLQVCDLTRTLWHRGLMVLWLPVLVGRANFVLSQTTLSFSLGWRGVYEARGAQLAGLLSSGLQTQLKAARQQADQYKAIAEGVEQKLRQFNEVGIRACMFIHSCMYICTIICFLPLSLPLSCLLSQTLSHSLTPSPPHHVCPQQNLNDLSSNSKICHVAFRFSKAKKYRRRVSPRW